MCGIVGQFNYVSTLFPPDLWEKIIAMMHRRGPDDTGLWTDNKHCIFGCKRLSIIDVDPVANLPMRSVDGNYILAYNGELYNFQELRNELKLKGYRFYTKGDSEVVLNSLIEWQESAFNKFNGMFAVAFYDLKNKNILLGRDHAGIKPLYYLLGSQGILFASQYDQILAHPWSKKLTYSKESIELYLRLGYIPPPLALLDNTYMLEAGSWLALDLKGNCKVHKYFNFIQSQDINKGLLKEDILERISVSIIQSVKSQMVSDVAVGSFLSGGIDSPLISAIMAKELRGKLPTFSIGLDNKNLDESEEIITYAKYIGAESHMETLTDNLAESLFTEVLDSIKEPMADEGIFPSLLVSKLARKHVKVVLSGEGGDELFWGYYPRQAPIIRNEANEYNTSGRKYFSFFSSFTERQFKRCFPEIEWLPSKNQIFNFDSTDPNENARFMRQYEFEMYLPFILLKTDRSSMHHSLEVRVPLLDRRVIDLASQIDFNMCIDIGKGIGKMPLRNVLNKFVPRQTKAKKGFTISMDEWIRKPLRGIMEESLQTLRGLEYFNINHKAILELFTNHIKRVENNGMALWQLLILDQWLKRYIA